MNQLILYTSEDGQSQVQLRGDRGTVWLTHRGAHYNLDAQKADEKGEAELRALENRIKNRKGTSS